MLDVKNIRSLSDFQRNARRHIKRLKRSGKPEVLTINGKAELIVQDAASYQKLVEAADLAESVRTLRHRLQDPPINDVPASRFLKNVRTKMGLAEGA